MTKQGQYTVSTIIAARQDTIRRGLQMLLESFSHIDIVGVCASCEEVETILEDTRPNLVVLTVTGCGKGLHDMLVFLHKNYPSTRCIVIAEDIYQQKIALDAGAHAVLLEGFLSVEMLDLIETLMFNMRISQQGMTCNQSCHELFNLKSLV